jgi:hypothetical protein
MQPSPEQWYESLDHADRKAYLAAAESGHLTEDLYRKMAAANIPAAKVAFERSDPANLSPRHYLRYVRQRKLEAEGDEGPASATSAVLQTNGRRPPSHPIHAVLE